MRTATDDGRAFFLVGERPEVYIPELGTDHRPSTRGRTVVLIGGVDTTANKPVTGSAVLRTPAEG